MPAPALISFADFLANANAADVRALALLAGDEVIKTQDAAEADTYQALGVRLFNAGVVTRFRRSIEVIGGDVWHVFDGRVPVAARVYVADAAKLHIDHLRSLVKVPDLTYPV